MIKVLYNSKKKKKDNTWIHHAKLTLGGCFYLSYLYKFLNLKERINLLRDGIIAKKQTKNKNKTNKKSHMK